MTSRLLSFSFVGFLALALCPGLAQAQKIPKSMKGTIITSTKPIKIPTSVKGFVKKLKKQDRLNFKKDDEGKWTVHFVAFFKKALPVEQMGVVVLDSKKEPVAVANVGGAKGQTTLASMITIDSTEFPGKLHTLQVFYAKGQKPIVLAKKKIKLK